MKHAIYIVIILLMGAFIFYQIRQAKIQQEFAFARSAQFADAIEKARNQAAIHKDSAAWERASRNRSDSASAVKIASLVAKDKKFTKQSKDLREPVQPLIDSIQALGAFVGAQDSTLAVRQGIIVRQGKRIQSDSVSFLKESDHLKEENLKTVEALGTAILLADNFQERYLKAEKQAKKKFTVGPYVGYGVSKDGLSPSIGVSVQFRLLRF